MSISRIAVIIIGLVLAVAGLMALLSLIGFGPIPTGQAGSFPWWATLILGFLFLGGGVYIVRGGNITA